MHVQKNTVLLTDLFENFENISLKIYELDHAHFLTTPALPWQAPFGKTNVKLDCF